MHARLSEACRLSRGWLKPHEKYMFAHCPDDRSATRYSMAGPAGWLQPGGGGCGGVVGTVSEPPPGGQLPAATSPAAPIMNAGSSRTLPERCPNGRSRQCPESLWA